MQHNEPNRLATLLDQVIEQEFPGQTNLLPAILERIAAQNQSRAVSKRSLQRSNAHGQQRPRFSRAIFATTCLVLVSLVVYALLPRTVTAAEIVSRIEQSTATPNAFGLKSFHGRFVASHHVGTEETIVYETELWYVEPDRYRMVSTVMMSDTPPTTQIMLVQGTTMWRYDTHQAYGTVEEINPSNSLFQVQSIDEFIAQMQADDPSQHTIELVGSEVIAGREAYVLEVRTHNALNSRMRMWVDSEFYLPLQQEVYDATNPNQVHRGRFTQFEANGPVDSSLMSLPANVIFEPAGTRLPSLWGSASAPFALFEPTVIPGLSNETQLSTGIESHLEAQPPMMIADYFIQGEEQENGGQLAVELRHLFRMSIAPTTDPSGCNPAEQAMGGVVVQLGNIQGCSYTDPNPQAGETLSLIRDGVRIVFTVDQWSVTTKSELLEIAASLQRVEP